MTFTNALESLITLRNVEQTVVSLYLTSTQNNLSIFAVIAKQDGVESALPSSYTGSGEPANVQCHGSAGTATATATAR